MAKLATAQIEGIFYINGFPKAGLHLLDLIIRPMAMPLPYDVVWNTPWAGMFRGNSWTVNRQRKYQITKKLARVQPGHFLKGHLGYDTDIDTMMFFMGYTHYFIVRDFRDVAVSQTYHIMSDEELVFAHPDKEAFKALGGFDEILEAVIVGLTVGKTEYPGVFRRWQEYAPWWDVDWICKMKFEEIINTPKTQALRMLDHFFGRMEIILNMDPEKRGVTEEELDQIATEMVATSLRKKTSPTFRKGLTGEWHTHFKSHHKDLMKETDVDDWLIKLGYEEDKDW